MVSKRTDDRFVGGGSCSSCSSNVCFVVLVERYEGAELMHVELGRVNVDLQLVGLLVFTVPEIEMEGLFSWIIGDMFVDFLVCSEE